MFISYELDRTIHGYARLRIDENATIWELKVLGRSTPIGKSSKDDSSQHVGLGSSLLKICEEHTRGEGHDKLRITAGIGVREYYRSNGYTLDGTYMVKDLYS